MSIAVRPVTRKDAAAWLSMQCDLWPDGTESIHAHRALGLEDAGLVRCFRKDLHRERA